MDHLYVCMYIYIYHIKFGSMGSCSIIINNIFSAVVEYS